MTNVIARPWTRAAIFSAVAALPAFIGWAPPVAAMSGYTWKKRPLVVFAPAATSENLSRQRGIVTALKPAFQDRQIVVIYVVGDQVSADLGPGPNLGADALRARYGVGTGSFRAILVGKDGGVRLSSPRPIAAATLFATIDAMPMRKEELRKN